MFHKPTLLKCFYFWLCRVPQIMVYTVTIPKTQRCPSACLCISCKCLVCERLCVCVCSLGVSVNFCDWMDHFTEVLCSGLAWWENEKGRREYRDDWKLCWPMKYTVFKSDQDRGEKWKRGWEKDRSYKYGPYHSILVENTKFGETKIFTCCCWYSHVKQDDNFVCVQDFHHQVSYK